MSTETDTKVSSDEVLIDTVRATLDTKLEAYAEILGESTEAKIAARERHEAERAELRERQVAEIEALGGDSLELAEKYAELIRLRAFLSTLEVDTNDINIPAVPGMTGRRSGTTRSASTVTDRKAQITKLLSEHPDGLTAPEIAKMLTDGLDSMSQAAQQAEKNRTQSCLASGQKSGHFVSEKTGVGNGNLWKLAAVAPAAAITIG